MQSWGLQPLCIPFLLAILASPSRNQWSEKGYLPCKRSFTVLGLRWLLPVLPFRPFCGNWKSVPSKVMWFATFYIFIHRGVDWHGLAPGDRYEVWARTAFCNASTSSPTQAITKVAKTFCAKNFLHQNTRKGGGWGWGWSGWVGGGKPLSAIDLKS